MLDAAHTHAIIAADGQSGTSRFAGLPSGSRPAWCVVASLPKAERRAHVELRRRGFEAYLPFITIRWRDRTWHTTALFPGYLFVRLDLTKPWNGVRFTPGVFQLLCIDGTPSICPEAAVDALRATEAARATPAPKDASWAPGMPCSPARGVMAGLPAVVLAITADTARIALLFLGELRQISMHVDCLAARDEA